MKALEKRVSVSPGKRAFTRIPNGASSLAKDFVIATMTAFVIE